MCDIKIIYFFEVRAQFCGHSCLLYTNTSVRDSSTVSRTPVSRTLTQLYCLFTFTGPGPSTAIRTPGSRTFVFQTPVPGPLSSEHQRTGTFSIIMNERSPVKQKIQTPASGTAQPSHEHQCPGRPTNISLGLKLIVLYKLILLIWP